MSWVQVSPGTPSISIIKDFSNTEISEIAKKVSEDIIFDKNKAERPQVLVLMGLQYAGNSYLAEKIIEKNYAHFWATKIKQSYNIGNPEMISIAVDVIEQVTAAGYNLVIDFVNHKYNMRR